MTEKDPEPRVEEEEDDDLDSKLNYKPPPQKSLKELQEMDKDDESLAKYKKTLLGDGPVVTDPTAPNVTVTRLTLVCESAPAPITMDLTGDLEALKKETIVLKEGAEYRAKIHFKVNRDIVSGLKYVQHTYRTGVKVDKATFMVGSYGPRPEEYEFLTPVEEAPKGMLAREVEASLGASCKVPRALRAPQPITYKVGCPESAFQTQSPELEQKQERHNGSCPIQVHVPPISPHV
uniref:Endoplasmic reticulum protein 27 n=1 Tax=Callithrix jacchus TaxID=9483 RepID=A0A2R8MTL6_CALJA